MRNRTQSGSIVAVILVLLSAVIVGAAIPLLSGGRNLSYDAHGWTPPPTRVTTGTVPSPGPVARRTQVLSLAAQPAENQGPFLTPTATATGAALSPTLTAMPSPVMLTVTFTSGPTSLKTETSSPAAGTLSAPTMSPTTLALQAQPPPAGVTPPAEGVVNLLTVTPVAVSAPRPTPRRLPTATPGVFDAVSPPALVSPSDGASARGVIRFEWLPTGPLPAGAGYEVVWWNPEEPPEAARGLAPPTQANLLELNIDSLFSSGQVPGGRLFWTVLIVRSAPYARLTQPAQSPQHRFIYAGEAPVAPAQPPPPRP